MLVVDGVDTSHGELLVQIRDETITGLLGRNGSGKTTVLRLILGRDSGRKQVVYYE